MIETDSQRIAAATELMQASSLLHDDIADDDRARSSAAGFDAHLTKPAGIAEIGELLLRLPGGGSGA